MKHRIARFAPHQNAKTVAIMTAIISLVVVIPVFLLGAMFAPSEQRVPFWAILLVPIFYLVITYIVWVIACAIYNVLVPITGGLEFESSNP